MTQTLQAAQAALSQAQEAVRDTPEVRLLQAEVNELDARIAMLDEQIADLQPDAEAAQTAVKALEVELQDVQTRLAAAVGVRRKALGKLDSVRLTRTQLKGQRSVKAEALAVLRERGPSPVVRWAGG